jgi:hypothetical protein
MVPGLPRASEAIVDARKVHDYLLSESHPLGKFKAAFFGWLGYSRDEWELLAIDLRAQAVRFDATPTEERAFGRKYEVRGTIIGPSGRSARLVSIWIVRTGENTPRLVTAFPGVRP